jgi:microcystin-dependent protein
LGVNKISFLKKKREGVDKMGVITIANSFILLGFFGVIITYGVFTFTFNNNHNSEISTLKADVIETNQLIDDVNTTLSEEIETVNTTLCTKIIDVNSTLSSEIDSILSIFNSVNMSIYFDLNEALVIVNETLNQEITELNDTLCVKIMDGDTSLQNTITTVNSTLCDKIMEGDTLLQSSITTLNSTFITQLSSTLLSINNVTGDMMNQNVNLKVSGGGVEIDPDAMTHEIRLKNTGVVTLNSVPSLLGSSDLLVVGAGMIAVNSYPLTSTIEIDGTSLSTALSNLQMQTNMQQMEIVSLSSNVTNIQTQINNIQMVGDMIAQDLNGTVITFNMTLEQLIMDVMTLQTTVTSLQSQIDALNSNTSGVPTGTISPFGGTVIPAGYLLCDGTQYSTTTYADLFNIVGTMYCPGPCTMGMFAVPDLRGKVPAGQGGTALSGTIGSSVGAETHTLSSAEMPTHSHPGCTDAQGSHFHSVTQFAVNSVGVPRDFPLRGPGPGILGSPFQTDFQGNHAHCFTTSPAGSSMPHNNIQPSLIIKYIIKT